MAWTFLVGISVRRRSIVDQLAKDKRDQTWSTSSKIVRVLGQKLQFLKTLQVWYIL